MFWEFLRRKDKPKNRQSRLREGHDASRAVEADILFPLSFSTRFFVFRNHLSGKSPFN